MFELIGVAVVLGLAALWVVKSDSDTAFRIREWFKDLFNKN